MAIYPTNHEIQVMIEQADNITLYLCGTTEAILSQIITKWCITQVYDQYAKRYGMTAETYAKQRVCAKCGSSASEDNKLYPIKNGQKICRNCLPFKATFWEGKTKLVITDRAKFDAYNRRGELESALRELSADESTRLQVLRGKAVQSPNLYAAERLYCNLCRHRYTYFRVDLDLSRQQINQVTQEDFRQVVGKQLTADITARRKYWYYRRTWGWNPEQVKLPLESSTNNYKWEEFFPLGNDPAIHAAGVEIGARVEVFDETIGNLPMYIKGRIVFRLNVCPNVQCISMNHPHYCRDCPKTEGNPRYFERTVDCTHVAIADIPLDQIPETTELDSKGREWAKTTENRAVKLDPEEHYMALRSYVQGIAEVGLETMFASRYPDDPLSLPFGFNTLMQKQVLFCLKELCPNAAKSILYKAIGYILESAPDEWIIKRITLLHNTYGFRDILKEHEFWEMSDKSTQKRIVALLGKLAPFKKMVNGNHINEVIVDEGILLPPPLHILEVPVTALHNGERPLDFAAISIRVRFSAGSLVHMNLEGDIHEMFPGDPVELTDNWLSVQKLRVVVNETPHMEAVFERFDNVHMMCTVRFMASVVHTYPAVEQLREQRQDAAFRRELEAPFIPPDNTILDEDQVRYLVGQTRAVLGTINFDEDLLRQSVFQAVAEIQAQWRYLQNGFVPTVVHRAEELYRNALRRQYNIY